MSRWILIYPWFTSVSVIQGTCQTFLSTQFVIMFPKFRLSKMTKFLSLIATVQLKWEVSYVQTENCANFWEIPKTFRSSELFNLALHARTGELHSETFLMPVGCVETLSVAHPLYILNTCNLDLVLGFSLREARRKLECLVEIVRVLSLLLWIWRGAWLRRDWIPPCRAERRPIPRGSHATIKTGILERSD